METILHLSTSFGDQSAGYRLHKSLRELNINSRVLTGSQSINDPVLRQPEGFFDRRISRLKMVFDQYPLKLYPHRTGGPFSPAIVPDFVIRKIMSENPSLINLHWINGGFVQIETLKKIRVPIVWTMHDSWAFTGGCHIPYECKKYCDNCGQCPILGSKRLNDLSRSVFLRKQKSWKNLDIVIVTPSNWLRGCVNDSELFYGNYTEVIPNGIDINQFKPFNKEIARERLSLPKNKKLILFGAFNCTRDPNKGFEFLKKALLFIKNNKKINDAEMVIFGENDVINSQDCELKLHSLGLIRDSQVLAMLYSAADVFVAPSLSENLPNTIMESLSCGTPTVAFHIGGIPDLVDHKSNGYLAVPFDPEDLARGIEWVLSDEKTWNFLSRNAREKIINEFEITKISQRYIELYSKILKKGEKN
jgi:glycosyltransferase involved in cell wall biosynthesis